MSKAQMTFLIERMRERKANAASTLAESRVEMDAIEKVFPLESDIRSEAITLDCETGVIEGAWITPPDAALERVLFYLHGGGYAEGSITSHRALIGRLARAGGVRALAINYRLAPEHPFPAGLEDAKAAYRWLLQQGISPGHIFMAGDSAGGGLTLATLLSLRDEGAPLPVGAAVISPWSDLALTGDSMASKAGIDPMLSPESAKTYAGYYTNGQNPRNPLISPLYADFSGLPPLLIQVGTAEILLDDAVRVADQARAGGVEVTFAAWEEMIHVWHFFAPMLDEGQQAIDTLGKFMRARWR